MKVAIFLDYANVESSYNSAGDEIDYGALLNYLADDEEQRNLMVAYAYVPVDPRQEHAMDKTIENLWNQGYVVKSKVGTVAGDSYKCDFDVEMTMDMVRTAFDIHPNIIVLVSGDSDFVPVVLDLRNRGIRVEVASFRGSLSGLLSRRCSGCIDLNLLIPIEEEEQEKKEGGLENSYQSECVEDTKTMNDREWECKF